MFKLIEPFKKSIGGVIHGFDRLVFQGFIMPIMYSEGAMSFLNANQVLYKDAKAWFQTHTSRLIESIESAVMKECGSNIVYLPSSRIRKEAVAHQRQQELGIESELIGAWSCVEAGNSFRIRPADGFPNKNLREILASHHQFGDKSKKQLSGAVTRLIRLIRDHRLIRKLPGQHRYRMTSQGQKITALIQVALAASTKEILDCAA